MEKALCNLGADLASSVTGRVSTEGTLKRSFGHSLLTHFRPQLTVAWRTTRTRSWPRRAACSVCIPRVRPRVRHFGFAFLTHSFQVGVPRHRVLFRFHATHAGLEAAAKLEAEGIACHLVSVFS